MRVVANQGRSRASNLRRPRRVIPQCRMSVGFRPGGQVIAALRRALVLLLAALAVPALAATPPASPAPAHRLGTDVVPVFQAVRLEADARKPDYTGSVRIELDVRKPVSAFALHARDIEISAVSLTGPGGPVEARHGGGDRGRLDVTTAAPLRPGRHVLEIEFANEYDTQATGLYKVVVGDDVVPVHPVRGRRRAAGVPVLGRAGVQDPVRADGGGARGPRRGVEHAAGVGHGEGRAAHGGLRPHQAAAVLPAGPGHRAARVRAHPGHVRRRAAW